MFRTLSKELCERCDIHPLDDENAYFTGNLGNLPNFGDAENFTKLFEICCKDSVFAEIIYRNQIRDRYDFIKSLIEYIDTDKSSEKVVTSINKETWEYDKI